jgi:two-component system response regulator GlrR
MNDTLPPAVAICASARHDELAKRLWRSLQGIGGLSQVRERADGADPAPALALWVRVVGADEVDAALRQLAALRDRQPGCSALLVVDGCDRCTLEALVAGGGADFVDAAAPPAEFVVRVERLLGRIAVPATYAAAPELPELIGRSPAFAEQVARLPTIAHFEVSVLLLGETGTGKEVFAQAAHYLSPRAGQPWVAVNCGAIPGELIEDELFGHVRGAYTHAHVARPGLIREAEGGTLFLDEIDALPYNAQVKLLRFLQDKQYRPVGANAVCHADVRVFAASNRALASLAAQGSFRQDLYFRLNVVTLRLPPLRERREDIAPLARHFLQAAARQWQRPAATLSCAAHAKLLAHSWPGNVRELKNAMDRATMLKAGGVLGAEDIDLDDDRTPAAALAGQESFRAAKERLVENFERAYIEQLLAESGGNVTHAARAAQKNRRAFFELMRKYRIEPERYRLTPH